MIPLKDDNPTSLRPVVNLALIAICVVVFLWQLSLDRRAAQEFVYALGAIPAVLLGNARLPAGLELVPPWVTVFTSMFLHGGWLHLIGNMLYLWIFGDNIEDAMGHVRYAVFYFICGMAAVAAQSLPDPASTVPMIGASGAISGVLGAYLLLHPRAGVMVLIPLGIFSQIIRLPALLVLGIWFLLQLIPSFGAAGSGGVAFRAHVGGFLAGLVLVGLFKRRRVRLWR